MSDSGTDISGSQSQLTTEDLAHPGRDTTSDTMSEQSPPAYPGEATTVPEDTSEPAGSDDFGNSGDIGETEGRGTDSGYGDDTTGRDEATEPAGTDEAERTEEPGERGEEEGARTAEQGEGADEGKEGEEPLIAASESESYRERWGRIQGDFVDDPKEAVRAADSLVAEVIQSLAETFSDHKKELEAQWSRGEEVKTEGLRLALQQYRTFFNKLLHA
ncbi:hypothetical protein [Streptomyces sp. NPDC005573]|uniref:hypothetical protein n=1 Tax=Streptomyces sp. NPDC005573 TaxID=3156890 RepID=UPI0033AA78E2